MEDITGRQNGIDRAVIDDIGYDPLEGYVPVDLPPVHAVLIQPAARSVSKMQIGEVSYRYQTLTIHMMHGTEQIIVLAG
jgi:hypothetical protein